MHEAEAVVAEGEERGEPRRKRRPERSLASADVAA